MSYKTLLNILDAIRNEAPEPYKNKYIFEHKDTDNINQARSRTLIHLYLKVMYGLLDFSERESYITDGPYDGGIDGYYINDENKTIYLIQSKFRTTEKNFESKEITLSELLSMDIDRITDGELESEDGFSYNENIHYFQKKLQSTEQITKYSYRVIILANLQSQKSSDLRKVFGSFSYDIFNFEKTYKNLVFPVICGNYYRANEITIPIDLSHKNAGNKISYNVDTRHGNCEITVLFAPILEIAKIMEKYKNAILQYNPRSYLELTGKSVNNAIRATVMNSKTNEFALFNNGITILSDETNINEKVGLKNKAKLSIKNPQIINGGQTSYTLSMLYKENKNNDLSIFENKEVLLKIITLLDVESKEKTYDLIEEISEATNKQTPVIGADKLSNEKLHILIQEKLFEELGLLYERKRGEFSDGLSDRYINKKDIIERNEFWRIALCAKKELRKSFSKKLFEKTNIEENHEDLFDWGRIYVIAKSVKSLSMSKKIITNNTYKEILSKSYLNMMLHYKEHSSINKNYIKIPTDIDTIQNNWSAFIEYLSAMDESPLLESKLDKNKNLVKIVSVRNFLSKDPQKYIDEYIQLQDNKKI